MLDELLKWAKLYLSDPRIWGMVASLLVSLGITVEPGLQQTVVLILTALSGLAAIFTAARKDAKAKALQQTLGVKPDGDLGPKTQAAAAGALTPVNKE